MKKLGIFVNLFKYVDSSFIVCPACGNFVKLSWGWCPYHATQEQFELETSSGAANSKESFVRFLQKNYPSKTIVDIIEPMDYQDKSGSLNGDRFLVHWSEFLVVK
ncbi:MAG: hypothetical protein GF344_11635 [Chitinivibrionales bacterium]|nr:hypothetical protein [Chitinivibrionales bacterium]